MPQQEQARQFTKASIFLLAILFLSMTALVKWIYAPPPPPCYDTSDRGLPFSRLDEIPAHLLIVRDVPWELNFYAIDDSGQTVCQFSAAETNAVISPDESMIAFEFNSYPKRILISNIEGNSIHELKPETDYPYPSRFPVWSPDSQRIAFLYGDIGNAAFIASPSGDYLRGIDLDGTGLHSQTWAAWSPDSEWLAIAVGLGPGNSGNAGLYLLDREGMELRQILAVDAENQIAEPRWSETGETIHYLAGGVYNNQVYDYEYSESCIISLETQSVECETLN